MSDTRVRILLEVVRREGDGEIMSAHRPFEVSDKEQMREWPSAGLAQVSHAMFVEALRREAYTTMIAKLSQGVHIHDLDPEELESSVRVHLGEMLDKFAASAVAEALKMTGR